ncbi:DUF1622 domain-containing protein [Porphyrobacter sp. CACIAM 03H1]|uniref:DUF1622 domain-containing protein n=1 Tax=Porphyrobacter sp. CACIAM 03H1 TaxID=2003315 RepID=UPI001F33D526|nr:DUF1622 domain-containing protein [Porphyrobacter sp. CACIAM 03H1]
MIDDATMLAVARGVAQVFELAGLAVIVLGALIAAAGLARPGATSGEDRVAIFRRMLGRAILTGLELLVAADIIRTVAIDPTLESVAVLGLIVLIRTFLSFSLEVEIDGRWPWQKKAKAEGSGQAAGKDGG